MIPYFMVLDLLGFRVFVYLWYRVPQIDFKMILINLDTTSVWGLAKFRRSWVYTFSIGRYVGTLFQPCILRSSEDLVSWLRKRHNTESPEPSSARFVSPDGPKQFLS